MKKAKFIYELQCNLYGNDFFTSLHKAKEYKSYLEQNGSLDVIEEFPSSKFRYSSIQFDAEYRNNVRITIYKRELNSFKR
jgi:hypothetical protein